jgi:DegV family protein with EDD domain
VPAALVTDSTAYLPPELVERFAVTVVPLQVLLAGKAFDENEIASRDVAEALRSRTPVTTSRPSPAMFASAYARLVSAGYDAVVSVHISAEMSGTAGAARLAAAEVPVPVEVVDSRCLGMGLGYAVVAAGQALAAGRTVTEAVTAARVRAANSSTCFYVDTLEHLRRGGRIGAAAAALGSTLAIKPLLGLDDGRVVPLEKVRTATRAIARLEDIALAAVPAGRRVDLAVHHLDARERADALAERLAARARGVADVGDVLVLEVGAVVGAHVGPGMLAVVVSPRPDPPAGATSD